MAGQKLGPWISNGDNKTAIAIFLGDIPHSGWWNHIFKLYTPENYSMEPQHPPWKEEEKHRPKPPMFGFHISFWRGVFAIGKYMKILQLVQWCTWIWFGLYISFPLTKDPMKRWFFERSLNGHCSVEKTHASLNQHAAPNRYMCLLCELVTSRHVMEGTLPKWWELMRGNRPKWTKMTWIWVGEILLLQQWKWKMAENWIGNFCWREPS